MRSLNREEVALLAGRAIQALREGPGQDAAARLALEALEALTTYASDLEMRHDDAIELLHQHTNKQLAS